MQGSTLKEKFSFQQAFFRPLFHTWSSALILAHKRRKYALQKTRFFKNVSPTLKGEGNWRVGHVQRPNQKTICD
jgi:hypothetical protein